jgi:hypothetical protein
VRSFPSLIGKAGQSVIKHLDRLRATLDELREHLREAVVQAVGHSVAGAVRDAVHAALEALAARPPERFSSAWSRDASHWPGSHALFAEDDLDAADRCDELERDAGYAEDDLDDEPQQKPQTAPPEESSASRWRHALAIGCGTVAWYLRRQASRFSALATVGVGMATTAAAYVVGPGLIASALSLSGITETMKAGVALLARS